jgi:hypothetical protein
MAIEETSENTSDDNARHERVSETISQFAARVLGQLSLVAWLPAGALVLALTFVLKLNSVLDNKPMDAGVAIGRAFDEMTKIGFVGALLLFAIVIVLTVLTQVFAFDAILVLEGYWGTSRVVELIAKWRCAHFRNQCTDLCRRRDDLFQEAQRAARAEIERRRAKAISRQGASDEIERARTVLSEKIIPPDLMQRHAPPDLLRRQANVIRRLADFPLSNPPRFSYIMPIRLGNIMMHAYVDQLGLEKVGQAYVLEIYDRLPTHLRAQHDEWRVRLDLYCSMVFVVALTTTVSTVLLAPQHWRHGISAVAVGSVAVWLVYRGAIATARYYGLLLVRMKDYRMSSVENADSES